MSPHLLPTILAQTGIEKEVWQRTRKVIREAKGPFSPGIGLKQGIALMLDIRGHRGWTQMSIRI